MLGLGVTKQDVGPGWLVSETLFPHNADEVAGNSGIAGSSWQPSIPKPVQHEAGLDG